MPELTIPQIRERLSYIAKKLDLSEPSIANEVRYLISQLFRRPAIQRIETRAPRSSHSLRQQIRAYAATHPNLSQQLMAVHFNVNPGRISEALAGFRGHHRHRENMREAS